MANKTDPNVPPNPAAERSLIIKIGGVRIGFRIWNKTWETAEELANADRDRIWLLSLDGKPVVEIREVQ